MGGSILPIRAKLILLMSVALVGSVGAIFAVGASIFVEDKGSYILDFNYNQVRAAAGAVDDQIQRAVMFMRLVQTHQERGDNARIDRVFAEAAKGIGLKRVLAASTAGKETHLKPTLMLGDDGTLQYSLNRLGWDRIRMQSEPVLIGRFSADELAVGVWAKNPAGGGTAYVGFLKPNLNLAEEGDFQVFLVDGFGEPLYARSHDYEGKRERAITKLLKKLSGDPVTSGVRKWSSKGDDFLVAYHRLEFKELIVVGLISEKLAYSALTGLFFRSAAMGIGVILVMIGLTLGLVKKMTEGLRQMAAVTEKVAQGVFSFRVDTRSLGQDEIGALASSFNVMADRIDQLMFEVESKIENKHDQEAVTAVQSYLFPNEGLQLPNINIAGASIPAKQCGGDWWHYEKIGDYVLLMVGKVEGKGLSAAMTMAAAHGAVATFVATTKMLPKGPPFFKLLVSHMNSAVYVASKGKTKMPCFIGMFDTFSGQLMMVNCGHSLPYVHRIEFGGRPQLDEERYFKLAKAKHPQLGVSEEMSKLEPESIQLKAGDLVFLHTQGLMKESGPRGNTIGQKQVFSFLAQLYDHYETQSQKICEAFFEKSTEYLGVSGAPTGAASSGEEDGLEFVPSDDLTAVVVAIPKKAYFMQREETPSAAA